MQTGYGPSGLPHIGTFGEVARTSMVVNALNHLTDLPKEIITFSDDMDGLRKIPDNVPNKDMLNKNLNKPLTKVPDPFGKFNSFGEHNNEMLKNFLNNFKFSYTFQSSTELYKKGFFNETLILILNNFTITNYETYKNKQFNSIDDIAWKRKLHDESRIQVDDDVEVLQYII